MKFSRTKAPETSGAFFMPSYKLSKKYCVILL